MFRPIQLPPPPPPELLTIQEGGIKYRWFLSQGSATNSLIPTLLVWPLPSNDDVGVYVTNGINKIKEQFGEHINMKILFQSVSYGLYNLTSPLLLSPNITLEFEPGATIFFSGGSIGFNGCELIAGRYPILLHTDYWANYAEGRFSENKPTVNNAVKNLSVYNIFGQVRCKETYPEWFGAVGDWSYVDDIFALKYAMFFASLHTYSKTLSLANKSYYVCGSFSHNNDPNLPEVETGQIGRDLVAKHLNGFDNANIKLISPSQIMVPGEAMGSTVAFGHLTGLRIIGEPGATIESTSFTYSYEPDTESHLRRDDFGKHLYFELTNVALVQGIQFIDVGLVLRNQDTDVDNNPLEASSCHILNCEFVVTQDWAPIKSYRPRNYYPEGTAHNDVSKNGAIFNQWPTRCLDLSGNIKVNDTYFSGLVREYMRPVQQPRIEGCKFVNTNPLGFNELKYADYTTPVRKGIGINCTVFEDAIVAENHFEGLETAMFISGAVRSRFERNRLKNLLSGIIFLMNKAYARTSVLYNTISHNYIEDVFAESISFDSGHGTSSLVTFKAIEPDLSEAEQIKPRGFLVLNGTNIFKGKIVGIAPIQTVLNGEPETTINNPLRVYFQLQDGNHLLSKGINYGNTEVNFQTPVEKEAMLISNRKALLAYFNFMFQRYLASGNAFCTLTSGGGIQWEHQSNPEGHSFRILNAGRTENINAFPKAENLGDDYAHGWLDLEYFPERFQSGVNANHPGSIPDCYFKGSSTDEVAQASYLHHNSDQLVGAEISMQFIFGFNQIANNQIYFNEYRTQNFNLNNNQRNNVTKPNATSGFADPNPTNQTLYLNHRRWRFFHDFGADANGILFYGSSHYNIIANNQLQGARIGLHGMGADALGFGTYPGWDQNQYQFPANVHYSPNNFNLISGNQIIRANLYAINEMGTSFYPFPATYFNGNPSDLPDLRSFPNRNNGYNVAPNSGYRQPNELSERYFFNIGNELQFNLLAQGEYRLSWQKQFKLNDDEWFTWQKAQLHKIRETHLLLWPDYFNPGYYSQGTRFSFYLWVDNLQALVSSVPTNDPLYMKSTVNP